ncbi:MAG: tRNA (adenosine(37)-N6)-threonylcarbamoyltransferase complex transferase subunit TsaD [Fimbriimonadaceae bacterium]|nr:tRNA (adenosine(37)-N6)-threonylcarbamoyltransferase complex transferase subunit TsaD [Fimbriimonadaceae bacterium]
MGAASVTAADLALFPAPVLGLETSCDETSAAVLLGRGTRSSVVSSQAALHERWGGVVPEAAARAHVEAIVPVIREAVAQAGLGLSDIGAVAVTNRPGLVGALAVGLTAAKALAFARGIPLLGVHHLEGHLLSPVLTCADLEFPHVSLIVSGGHTEIVHVEAPGVYEILGETRDDAAGEAFDKGARLLGLGYPGGFAVQEAARDGAADRYTLPRALRGETLEFSFSGLKTALLRLVEAEGRSLSVPDAAAALQVAIVDVLVDRALRAVRRTEAPALTLVGGVAANLSLRARLAEECAREGIRFETPDLAYCTDNAAMIALAGSLRLANGERDGWDLDALPNAPLPYFRG